MRKLLILIASTLFVVPTFAAPPTSIDNFDRGVMLFQHGRWLDAQHELQAVREGKVELNSYQKRKLEYYLAACAIELGADSGIAALKNFDQDNPNSEFSNSVNFSLGSYHLSQEDPASAYNYFAKVNPKQLEGLGQEQYAIRRGLTEFELDSLANSYEYFSKIDPKSTYGDHATYYRSYIDYVNGDLSSAREGFESLAQNSTYSELVPFYLLQLDFKQGRYKEAIARGESLINQAVPARRAELLRVMAESWFRLNDFGSTISTLGKYIENGGTLEREENYLMGYSLYRTAQYDQALDYLRAACGADDALTQNSSFHLADCYLRNGSKELAKQAFALSSNDKYDPAIAKQALLNYGKLQYELGGGLFNEAIAVLGRYATLYPDSEQIDQVKELLIAAYYNSSDYDAAYQAIMQLPTRDAHINSALQKITYFGGLEQFKEGKLDNAEKLLKQSSEVTVNPKYIALAKFWLGEIEFMRGNFAAADKLYGDYLKVAPRSESEYGSALYNRGYCAFKLGDMTSAAHNFVDFVRTHTTADQLRGDGYNRLGDCYYATRNYNDAIAQYNKTIAIGGDVAHYARYQRAIATGVRGEVDAKISQLRSIIATNQGDYLAEANYQLGHSYISQQRYSDGAKALETFVEQYPSSPLRWTAYSDLGLAYLNLGQNEKSKEYYNKVITSSPQSSAAKDAMQGMRDIYLTQGEAEEYFNYAESVGMQGDLSVMARDSISFVAAQQLLLAGKNDQALKSFEKYVATYPKGYYLVDALFFMSDCQLKNEDKPAAKSSLEQLIAQPDNQYTYPAARSLARLYSADKQHDKAAPTWRRLYALSSNKAEQQLSATQYVRAVVAQDSPAATETMARDVETMKNCGAQATRESQFALAKVMDQQGKYDESLAIYRTLSKDLGTPEGAESYYYIIEDLYSKGDVDGCEKAIFELIDKGSSETYWLARAYITLGDVYIKKSDKFQARATYQSIVDGYTVANDGIIEMAQERIKLL